METITLTVSMLPSSLRDCAKRLKLIANSLEIPEPKPTPAPSLAVVLDVTAPIPPPPPPAPPTTDQAPPPVDKNGTPWDPELHAGNHARKQDGTWKARRGLGKSTPAETVNEATFDQVQAALNKLIEAGVEYDQPVSISVTRGAATTGGMKILRDTPDLSANWRALEAMTALAQQNGVEL